MTATSAKADPDQEYYPCMNKVMKDAVNCFTKTLYDTSKEFALTPKELYLNLREAEENLHFLEQQFELMDLPNQELESYQK